MKTLVNRTLLGIRLLGVAILLTGCASRRGPLTIIDFEPGEACQTYGLLRATALHDVRVSGCKCQTETDPRSTRANALLSLQRTAKAAHLNVGIIRREAVEVTMFTRYEDCCFVPDYVIVAELFSCPKVPRRPRPSQ